MKAGYASADITPDREVTLCGFAARCDQPATGIDDRLIVHALALQQRGETVLLLAFDLLGLGPEAVDRIHEGLDAAGVPAPREQRIFCCTHTHGAPAAVKLIGCGVIELTYLEQLTTAATQAAQAAIQSLQPAVLRKALLEVPEGNYNRRRVLEDGRVVMAQQPDAPVARTGPVWNELMLLRWEDQQGQPISGLAIWAAHACTVCDSRITGDFPAELCRRLAERYGHPFMYLQGSCGNLNPPLLEMNRGEMLGNVTRLMNCLPRDNEAVPWSKPLPTDPFGVTAEPIRLQYQALMGSDELQAIRDGMRSIEETGKGPIRFVAELTNILNTEPGEDPDPIMLRYIASILRRWGEETLQDGERRLREGCMLDIRTLHLGATALCFVAAEPFVETAYALREACPDRNVSLIGYGSPLIGYLPTDPALDEGGYEVDYAYRFYGHPAGFAKGSEPAALRAMIHTVNAQAAVAGRA
ncbi:MAG TPA: hypothetical protein PLS90_06845 [Candidatus Sumerlaeota bacterium]|nr:hypothetical protein [Candidatus Sumerlaeota bacterium]